MPAELSASVDVDCKAIYKVGGVHVNPHAKYRALRGELALYRHDIAHPPARTLPSANPSLPISDGSTRETAADLRKIVYTTNSIESL